MRNSPEIVDFLNELLTAELTAINQYFLHAKMLEHAGYCRLAKQKRGESIEEMKHADRVIDRILYLGGSPNVQRLGLVRIGEDAVQMHTNDLAVELEAVERLNRGIVLCTEKIDAGTRSLLEEVLEEEEEAIDWLEAQLALVQTLGKELYLAQQLHD